MENYNPVELLEGIFNFYPREEFINDREVIHRAFFKIRQKYFDLFRELIFRDNILFPRSRILDEILDGLQPDFLGKINPTYEVYRIKRERLAAHWELELKNKLEHRERDLKEIAIELEKAMENA